CNGPGPRAMEEPEELARPRMSLALAARGLARRMLAAIVGMPRHHLAKWLIAAVTFGVVWYIATYPLWTRGPAVKLSPSDRLKGEARHTRGTFKKVKVVVTIGSGKSEELDFAEVIWIGDTTRAPKDVSQLPRRLAIGEVIRVLCTHDVGGSVPAKLVSSAP